MATLISCATGNFTDASTWALVDTTSYLDSEAASTALTTSYVYTATFTPGAITVDGVAIKIANMTTGAATCSLELFNNTDTVSVTTVTINLADIANTANATAYNRGWMFFKFSASQTLVAGKAYKVGLKLSSVTSQGLTVYRNATAGNWSRMLRTTTTQAPASGDQLHVLGELTGTGTGNDITVTMDNTATTSFGPTVSGGPPQGITVCERGTLTWGTTAATNYYLKWKGGLFIGDGGTINIGTSGTRIPSTSTAILEMGVVTNGDTFIQSARGATVNIFGYENITTGSCITALSADEAVSSTSIDVVSTSGWANNDEIVIASTSRTGGECEKRTISSVNSSTNVTISSGLTYAHTGTGTVIAEVIHLTRNVKIRGLNATTGCGYLYFLGGNIKMSYVEIYYMGYATRAAIDYVHYPSENRFNAQFCSIHDCEVASTKGFQVTANSSGSMNSYVDDVSGIKFAYNVMYDIATNFITVNEGTGAPELDHICCLMSVSSGAGSGAGITISNQGTLLTYVTVIGFRYSSSTASYGISIGTTVFNATHQTGNFSYLEARANAGTGINLNDVQMGCSLSNSRACRNGGYGIYTACANTTISDCYFFGNVTAGIRLAVTSGLTTFVSCVIYSEASYTQSAGLYPSVNSPAFVGNINTLLENCNFGSGGSHSSGDVYMLSVMNMVGMIILRNCIFASSTEISFGNAPNYSSNFWVCSQKTDQTAGRHESYCDQGSVKTDTTLYRTSSPSMRLTPSAGSSTTKKLTNGPIGSNWYKKVDNGGTVSFSVYVRKSNTSTGDATTYNGNQPRLILRRNYALGITADTVLATATAASDGAWELLTGTSSTVTDDGILEFYVDCDGTTGWVNFDDIS